MTKFLNAYSGSVHVSGYVHISPDGEWSLSRVEVHSGGATKDEAGDMLFDQMEKQLELNAQDML